MHRWERGSSMAWFAVVAAFLILPLFLLVIDGARVLYAHARLQQATDAACQALAEASIEEQVNRFKQTGRVKPKITLRSTNAAFAAFNAMTRKDPVLKPAPGHWASAMTTLGLQYAPGMRPRCVAEAWVEVIFLGGIHNWPEGVVKIQASSIPDARSIRR